MKKIDLHTHLTLYPDLVSIRADGSRFLCTEEQLAVHDKLNVELGVILPLFAPTMGNEEARILSNRHPDRFTWFCNVDPRQSSDHAESDLGQIISHYKELGAKGLGELTTNLYADDPMMDNLFSHCEQLDMPVLIHIAPQVGGHYGIADELGLPRIEKMLKKHPGMRLIGHSAAFWSEISDGLLQENRNGYPKGKVTEGNLPRLLRDNGNLYCDLSAGSGSNAMMRDPEFAARFMEEFADRIFYGTDVCSANNTFQYAFDNFLTEMVANSMLSQENYEKIIRKNAAKLLGLPE